MAKNKNAVLLGTQRKTKFFQEINTKIEYLLEIKNIFKLKPITPLLRLLYGT